MSVAGADSRLPGDPTMSEQEAPEAKRVDPATEFDPTALDDEASATTPEAKECNDALKASYPEQKPNHFTMFGISSAVESARAEFGLSRFSASRGLDELQRAGLVSVGRRSGRPNAVTILEA